ncbi:abnormal spindle-like microcephaly-associated protein homolog [Denticeps clupeoides]|uniref:abnormal spindle-like microcephaly-associated protein homolog n=1 Tax=Denticeps clupeoides TaxID=299321 RepID=UPI0010A3A14E|nr:abnormal spindle-like microcephaly-associated protein homolog [Denticeps clupeoides]
MADVVPKKTRFAFSPTSRVSPDESPQRGGSKSDKENDASTPVLSLVQFSRAPFVSFGTVKLGLARTSYLRVFNPIEDVSADVRVDRIPSAKGFSVDHIHFTIDPEDSVLLNISWTPVEEGGVRELITFTANGVVKHQAVLLGRAEAPKKKKKSLWESIKHKQAEPPGTSKSRKVPSASNKSANKTFRVARQPRYQRDKQRSPLSQSNSNPQGRPRPRTGAVPAQSDSPLVLLVPADKILDKEVDCRVLNRTLSPIRMPVVPATPGSDPGSRLSVRDALAAIDSELLCGVSPPNACSSFEFSDSPESANEQANFADQDVQRAAPADLRLTYCVKPRAPPNERREGPAPLRIPVCSDTVTKAGPVHAGGPDRPKLKSSRRRLLEKTLELQPGGPAGSDSAVKGLPIIESDASVSTPNSSSVSSATTSHASTSQQDSRPPDPVTAAAFFSPFPVHKPLGHQARKRKSGELPNAEKVFPTKKSRSPAAAKEPSGTMRDKDSTTKIKPGARSSHSSTRRMDTKPRSKSRPPRPDQKGLSGASAKTSRVIATAQSKLTFIKPAQTAIPRHPLPFAAKNMFYDERWIEKQERGFTWWLNYVLTPDDFKVTTEVTKVSAMSLALGCSSFSIPRAPTKEEMSFRTYTARRWLNRLRRAACQLFTSDGMTMAIQRLELEVEAKRLLVRRDRHLWKDIGERQKVLNWLLSYNPLWLRIGLETIYGELISLESNSDAVGLAMFILGRLLWNPDIAVEFRHPKVPHLYRDGHEEALSRFTLKKLLLLVCFLDKAKESRMIEHDPCLFCMDAEFKTSKDLLLAFSRDFLSGEGILSRHLGYLGLSVSHAQTPLDEFNFAVKNLATDLRCGVRLVRIMELFNHDWSSSRRLRIPAISRLQKVHNVDLALQILKQKGVDLKDERGAMIESRDVVDGHREKTLSLLWKIIFAFQVEVLLDEVQLREEISFLQRTWRTKQKLDYLRSDRGLPQKTMKPRLVFEHSSEKIVLLMDWVNAVCQFYSLKVENFTVSFSDGRALCYLIHHYHPGHLSLVTVSQNTTQTVDSGSRGRLDLDNSCSDLDGSFETASVTRQAMDFKELLENEKTNFRLVNQAVSYLGGVPAMMNPADMSNTIPNEKVVTCFLSFLCARLLDLRNESRAARVIQIAWRRYRLRKDLETFQMRSAAAAKIQALVRRFLLKHRERRQAAAATVIQAAWRGRVQRRTMHKMKMQKMFALQNNAATIIQKAYRNWKLWDLLKRNRAAAVIQAAFRRWRRRQSTVRKAAAVKIQSWFRMHRCRKEYFDTRERAIRIQAWYRGQSQRRRFQASKRRHAAAAVIQSAFRAAVVRRHVAAMRRASAAIQRWFRACVRRDRERRRYLMARLAVVKLQALVRGWRVRRILHERNTAALRIQAAFRKAAARRAFLSLERAAVVVQRRYRARVVAERARKEYTALKRAAGTLQAVWRGRAGRKKVRQLQRSATLIQSWYRQRAAKRKAATAIQRQFRAVRLRRRFLALRRAAVVLQSGYRGTRARQQLRAKHEAATLIQRCYRAHRERRRYRQLRGAATALQAAYRGNRARRRLRASSDAATVIQAHFRMHRARVSYVAMKRAATIIQQRFRAHVQRRREREAYQTTRASVLTLQAAFRGMQTRTRVQKMHHAATVIQARFRMHRARLSYVAAKRAATIIQQRFRAHVQRRREREAYQTTRASVLTLQAAFRGMQTRTRVRKMHHAATVIQARFRGRAGLLAFQRTCWAARVIRQRFRAHRARTVAVREYAALKSAVLCIQAHYRGMRVRRRVMVMQNAAAVIQRGYGTYRRRRDFLSLWTAAVRIQRRFRATLLARRQRTRYLSMQASAVTVQSAFRGSKVRKEFRERSLAATVIQTGYRMFRARTGFRAVRLAVVILQRRFRLHLHAKRDRGAFLHLRRSAVLLQAAFRGNRLRREISRMHLAATVIQAQYRKYRCQKRYRRVLWAASTVQERFRANRLRDAQRRRYARQRRAAVVVQSAFRGYRARRQILCMQKMAAVIQRKFVSFRQRRRYLALKSAVGVCEQKYGALLEARRRRKEVLAKVDACIAIQAGCRGMMVRRELQKRHGAAVTLQCRFRGLVCRSYYGRLRWAATVIQVHFRARRDMKAEVETLRQKRRAAGVLQAAYRGMKARRRLRRMHRAAAVLQRRYRARLDRRRFLALRSSAVTVQQRYRATKAAREQRRRYRRLQLAALAVQAVYRGQKARGDIRRKHRAATVVQTAFRGHREVVKFQAMRLSAVIVQRRYRACVEGRDVRRSFRMLRQSAVVVQAAYRGLRARREVAVMHRAATVIQAGFRMSKQRSQFKKQRWAARVLQRRFRARRLRNRQVQRFRQVKKAAVCIQALFRGKRSRDLARRIRAARTIQRWYRSWRLVRKQRAGYAGARRAAAVLQAAFRCMRARRLAKRMRAAIKVQSALRMSLHRKRFLQLRSSAVRLQAGCRALVARRTYLAHRRAAVTLQRRHRANRAMREQRLLYLKTLQAVHRVQAHVRGLLQRRKYQKLKESTVTIQAHYRGMIERRKYKTSKAFIVLIQRRYRAHVLQQKERSNFLKIQTSVLLIQRAFRRHLDRKRTKREQAAVRIQAWFRGAAAQRNYVAYQAAIATVCRCIQTRLLQRRFRDVQQSVRIIQQRWRETLATRSQRCHYLTMTASAVTIQAFWRGHRTRLELQKERRAAVLLQATFRRHVQRRKFRESKIKEAADARRRLHFSAAVYHHLSAVKIQRALRAHWALRAAKEQLTSVVYIQRWVRAKLQRKRYLEDRAKVIATQRAARAWLSRRSRAAAVVQRAARRFLRTRRERRVLRGITKAQALWRGHRSRKLSDTSRVVSLRRRLSRVNRDVKEDDKLCNKTQAAIAFLFGCPNFAYIILALKYLETATRLSPECCECLVNSGATQTIVTLIQSCNRSVPSMEIIRLSVQVLLNLSKYNRTIEAVYSAEHSVEMLLDLLQIYREKAGDKVADKGGSIFTKACFLLLLLVQDGQRAAEVRRLPKALDRLCSIYRLTARKYKMDAERTVTKQKMNASLNGSFFTQATPRKQKPVPKFAPDWVLRRDKMKDIVDPLRAIQMLADALGVVP